jgi:hypothetical protein
MQSVLLKLHAAEIMHVRCVALHLLQYKLDLRLCDDLLLIHADNAGFLPKLSCATAPARPNAQPDIINR